MKDRSETDVVEAHKCLEALRAARVRGDASQARAHLKSGKALDPGGQVVGLSLEEGELLRFEGRLSAARAVLLEAQIRHPTNVWVARGLADLAYRQGDTKAAWTHLRDAQSRDTGGQIAVLAILEADLLIDAGRRSRAQAVLEEMIATHPDNIWGYHKLAVFLRDGRDSKGARRLLEAGLVRQPGHLMLGLELVQLDIAGGIWPEAVARLERLRAEHGPKSRILLPLLRCYRRVGKLAEELALLTQAVTAYPRDPGVLRHLFDTRAADIAPAHLDHLIDLARDRIGPDIAEELRLSALIRTASFVEALKHIRAGRQVRRDLAGARRLAQVLFGARHFRLGLRYLRFCLRRWPGDTGMMDIYVLRALKQGQEAEAAHMIGAAETVLPAGAISGYRLLLCGFCDDMEGAVGCYEALLENGQVTTAQREIIARLIYSRQDPATAGDLHARIGRPMEELDRPLHRCGLAGLMTLEFNMVNAELSDQGGFGSLEDWVQNNRQSPIPAIRLIDRWRATLDPDQDQLAAAVISRQVFQYWDRPEPPEAVQRMMESWASAHGFEHRVFDRGTARVFLRRTFGPTLVQAFHLAANPAEEADLLRLALLARLGGIWADADDVLYGDLRTVLGQGRGLILYREPLGGAIGNNFIAAPPGHPVILEALQIAHDALLQRNNESAWNKTGPGVLTRALGQHLARNPTAAGRAGITILDWAHLAREIATNNPVGYKAGSGYWDKAGQRRTDTGVWGVWEAALEAE